MSVTRAPSGVDRNRGRALTRNALFNLVGQVAPLVIGLAAMPTVIAGLGPAGFGLLGLVWTVFGYLALLDLGLGRATTRFAATVIARGAEREIAPLIHTAALVQLAVGSIVALVGVAAAEPLVSRLNVPATLRAEAVDAFVLIALVAPFMALANTFRGLLEAGQQFATVNLISAPASAGTYLIPLTGVWLGWSLGTIVACMVALRAATFIAYAAAAVRSWPTLAGPGGWDRVHFRNLVSFGGWITVSSVVSPLLVYIDRFAIGALLSVAAVGFYTAPHEMVTRFAILPMSIVATVFPAFAALSAAAGDRDRTRDLFVRSIKYVVAIVAPPLVVVAAFSGLLLNAWLGAEYARVAAPALTILSLGMIVNAVAHVPSTLLQASGRADVTAKLHLLELPLHLLVLWQLTSRWGITGAALAWSLRVALDGVLLFIVTRRMGLVPSRSLIRERLPSTALSLLACGAAIAMAAALPAGAALRGALAGLVLLVWSAFIWARVLEPAERSELIGALGLSRASQ